MAVRVEITGDFLVESSLARVNRALFGALSRSADVELSILAEPTAAVLEGNADDARLQAARAVRFAKPDVTVRHRWPPVFPRVASGAYVHVQPWEFGSIPAAWVPELQAVADEVWCYGTFVAKMYERAGIDPARIHVVPLGFDPAVFSPGPPPASSRLGDRCVFLYVGDTIERKGVDIALDAYLNAFQPSDQVVFIIKDFGAKMNAADEKRRERIISLRGRADVPPVVYLDNTFPDAALADLYRSATALVAPYRGEGFGLPILEAMACGRPVIVTRGGATDDFTTDETAIRVSATQRTLGRTYGGFDLAGEAFWLEPAREEIAAAMRRVYEHPGDVKAIGERAAAAVHAGWTWAHGADHARLRLQGLAGGTTLAASRGPDPGALHRLELSVASPHGEDGVLLELFRRIGTPDPWFVELVAPGAEAALSVYFARALGWRGIAIQGDATTYGQLAYQLAQNQIPLDLDLLALSPGGASAWERLGAFRPKIVVVQLAGDLDHARVSAAARDYAYLGTESTGSSAFFVRNDLLPRTHLRAQ